MFPRWQRKSHKLRFLPTIELLEKREVLDAALRFQSQQITVLENHPLVSATVELTEASTTPVEFFCNLRSDGSAIEEDDSRRGYCAGRWYAELPQSGNGLSVLV